MYEDATSKKFLLSNFLNYKTVDKMEQFAKIKKMLNHFTQHNIVMDETVIVVSSLISFSLLGSI